MNLDILKENFINPALADIISNFTSQYHRDNRKAPATPHTTRAGGVRSERAPRQSEAEKGQQETVRIEEGELHFNGYTNPKGWLPSCYLSVVVAGSAIHGHTLNHQNNRKAPATPPQGQAELSVRGTLYE